MRSSIPATAILVATTLALAPLTLRSALDAQEASAEPDGEMLFSEDFETDLAAWSFPLGEGHSVVDRADGKGAALELEVVGLPVYAIIRGSESWDAVRLEGSVLFPEDEHNYLGFIYRYLDDGRRIDFGSLYIKGNGSYLQANLHSDTNVGRTLYPEIRAALEGSRAIEIGSWQRFALEVVGGEAHLYVGEMTTPAMTLPSPITERGGFGFKPRNPGGAVLIDDLVARKIEAFSYQGEPVPDTPYRRDDFVTDWSVLGPLTAHVPQVESGPFDPTLAIEDDGRTVQWTPYPTDHRGAVNTARVTEFRGGRRVAYFHARVIAPQAADTVLSISNVDDVAIWVNGVFAGFAGRQSRAWWDTMTDEEHRPIRAPVRFAEGPNDIVVRVVGGVYASGGFYLAVGSPGS